MASLLYLGAVVFIVVLGSAVLAVAISPCSSARAEPPSSPLVAPSITGQAG